MSDYILLSLFIRGDVLIKQTVYVNVRDCDPLFFSI